MFEIYTFKTTATSPRGQGVSQKTQVNASHLNLEHQLISSSSTGVQSLTHRVLYICISKLTNIGSDNGLSPGRHQAIIWTSAEILLISSTQVSDSHLSPPGALQSRRASLQWT